MQHKGRRGPSKPKRGKGTRGLIKPPSSRGSWNLKGRKNNPYKEEEFSSLIISQHEATMHEDEDPFYAQWQGSTTRGYAVSVRDTFCCIPTKFFSCFLGQYTRPPIDYGQFLRQVKTGDIFLFEGKGGFSCLIQCATSMRYSHVGIAVKLVDPKNPTRPHFMIWESTGQDDTYDFITGTDKNGLRLVSMHEKLFEYAKKNFSITYRPMTIYDDEIRQRIASGETPIKAWEMFLRGAHIPYETDYVELINSHKRWVVGKRGHAGEHNRDSVFCSEAVMWFYRDAMGISLEDETNGITWVPEDFTPEDFAQENEGIPFTYSDPPRAGYGGQYIVASREITDPGLQSHYDSFSRNQRKLAVQFTSMLRRAIGETVQHRDGSTTTHLDGSKLWNIDFGENAYPLHDPETGTTSVSLDKYS